MLAHEVPEYVDNLARMISDTMGKSAVMFSANCGCVMYDIGENVFIGALCQDSAPKPHLLDSSST